MPQKSPLKLLFILVLLAAAVVTAVKHPPKLGLDLKGGTRLTLQGMPTAAVPVLNDTVMDSLHYRIEQRVNQFGISEAIVQKAGDNRLLVEIPGVTSPEEAKKQLGKVGNLTFKTEGADGTWLASGVGGKDLKSARLDTTQGGQWLIAFELTSEGAKTFSQLTQKLAPKNDKLGIFFDDELVSSPVVKSAIVDGAGVIEGDFSRDEAKAMVDVLNAGALPVDVQVIEESSVGPTLGAASLQQSLVAGLVGFGLIAVFMVAYYKWLGAVATVALAMYSLLTYALFTWFGVTFTLAGIAGFVLSVGMAVDANILIFERTKEEIASGRAMAKAIAVGFDRAFPSIFDSNMSTMITCGLLWWLGTGAVKGFALTLALGVAVSMFTAITVTRTLLDVVLQGDGSGSGQASPRMTFSRG
jgi:preprotein translocase subunit SecD